MKGHNRLISENVQLKDTHMIWGEYKYLVLPYENQESKKIIKFLKGTRRTCLSLLILAQLKS